MGRKGKKPRMNSMAGELSELSGGLGRGNGGGVIVKL